MNERYGFENPFKPDALSKKALKHLSSGKHFLDIGCGEGADSAFFAKRGFDVTAIDSNETYLHRFSQYCKHQQLSNITIHHADILKFDYGVDSYDVINCLLVICCMKPSEFGTVLVCVKKAIKAGGVIMMSSRNYLDPELNEYLSTEKMIEPNTFIKKEDCCKVSYFIEKDRLREAFKDFEIIFYDEGIYPCKYADHPVHGLSSIICRRKAIAANQ